MGKKILSTIKIIKRTVKDNGNGKPVQQQQDLNHTQIVTAKNN